MLNSFAEEGITLLDEVAPNVFIPVLSLNVDDDSENLQDYEEELMSSHDPEYDDTSDWTEYGSELEFE